MVGPDHTGPTGPTGPTGSTGSADAGRAWGWVAALRDGATTPWSHWPREAGTAAATARDLPGAQQLELARRVNLAGQGLPTRAEVVERVLTASAAGRGAPERELAGGVTPRPWGLAPVDPATLEEEDLLRVVATLVAEDVVAADPRHQRSPLDPVTALPARVRRRARRGLSRALPRRRAGHRLVGDPWRVMTARDVVLRRGGRLGGDDATVVVVGDDVATMLVDAYTARAFGAGVTSWQRWQRRLGPGDAHPLPVPADLAQVARRWGEAVGRDRVVVVADPGALAAALDLPARTADRLTPERPSADAVDLARRVAEPLATLVPPDERRRLLRRVLLPQVLADDARRPAGETSPLRVEPSRLPWVARRAERVRDDLRVAGYPVLGDLQSLVPVVGSPAAPGHGPDDARVLALAVRLLLGGAPSGSPSDPPARPDRSEEP
jgi:hypothetical protein